MNISDKKHIPMLCISTAMLLLCCIFLYCRHMTPESEDERADTYNENVHIADTAGVADMAQDMAQDMERKTSRHAGINTSSSGFRRTHGWTRIKGREALQSRGAREPDAVEDEWQLRFRTAEEMDAFLKEATLYSDVNIIDSDYTLLTAKIRTEDPASLDMLLRNTDTPPVEIGSNHWFQSPSPSAAPGAPSAYSAYAPIGAEGLSALGIDGSNASWGNGVTVALVDSGIRDTVLIDPSRITSVDLLDADMETVDETDISKAMHGTIMASIIGGNNEQLPGVAPEASFIDIRVLDDQARGDGFTIAKGIVTAVDMGADIINLSLAGMGDDMAVRSAVQYAIDNGVTLVAAAGNDGSDQTAYPARYPGVIAVGATDALGQHPDFSNTGQEMDVAAPGYGVYAAISSETMVRTNGTSASAAFVSGAIAGLMSLESLPAPAATGLVIAYADDSGEPGHDPAFGIGLVDFRRIRDRFEDYDDLATAGYFWHPYQPPEAGVPENAMLAVSVQNRGTLAVWNIMVEVTVNGMPSEHFIDSLEPGQSGSVETGLTMQELQQTGSAVVSVTVWSPDIQDKHPENNSTTYYLSN